MTEQRHQRVDVLSGFSQLCVHLHTFCYFSSEERIILMCSQKLFRTNVLIKSFLCVQSTTDFGMF